MCICRYIKILQTLYNFELRKARKKKISMHLYKHLRKVYSRVSLCIYMANYTKCMMHAGRCHSARIYLCIKEDYSEAESLKICEKFLLDDRQNFRPVENDSTLLQIQANSVKLNIDWI